VTKLPKQIKIGGYDYKVSETDDPILVDGRECAGSIDFYNCQILIKKSMSIDCKASTLVHEMIHGMINERRLDLGDKDEEITEALTNGLFALLKDNKFI